MPTLQKKVISAFIRSGCKRRLRLSLYPTDEERVPIGMPETQKARSGVGLAGQAGYKWQEEKIDELADVFGPDSIKQKKGGPQNKAIPQELRELIDEGAVQPYHFIVEARYNADNAPFRKGMGLETLADEHGEVLNISYNHADLIQVLPTRINAAPDERFEYSQQVHPDGSLTTLADDDERIRLRIIDIKLAAEPGAHYFAEVVYYALTLAGWLEQEELSDRFVVVAASAVWPGSYEASAIMLATSKLNRHGIPITLQALAQALEEDLELAPFDAFVPRLRYFFTTTLPNVLITPWKELSWHVDERCSGCEFIGYPWPLSGVQALDYNVLWCWPEAKRIGHASRVIGLSRGNRQQLGAPSISQLAQFKPDHAAFQRTPSLRAQQYRFPKRAEALIKNTSEIIEESGSDALMPRWPDLHLYVFLDYDLASAITVSFGIRAFWVEPVPYGVEPPEDRQVKRWNEKQGEVEVYIVDTRDLIREKEEFLKFLRALRGIIATVRQADNTNSNRRRSTYQIYLWDEAQRRHLQRVAGRHLAAVLADQQLHDLLWLFPPPELLINPDDASVRSPFTLVGRVVQNTVAINLAHYYTIFGVAQLYHTPEFTPPNVFTLYQDPFSNLIPAERIHELWTRRGQLQQTLAGIQEATQRKLMAMGAIVTKLERDLKPELLPSRLAAPTVPERIRLPRALAGLPPFSSLLYEFTRLNGALNDLESFAVRAMPPHEREARFKSAYLPIRLEGQPRTDALAQLSHTAGRILTSPALLVYALGSESRDVNLRPGDIGFALSPRNRPDFLILHPVQLIKPDFNLHTIGNPQSISTIAESGLTSVTIEAIDRQRGFIALRPNDSAYLTRVDDNARGAAKSRYTVEQARLIDLSHEVMLDPIDKDYLVKKVELTLVGIGYPELAFEQDNATVRLALGLQTAAPRDTYSPLTPAALFLWSGRLLSDTSVPRPLTAVRPLLERLLQQQQRNLNISQWHAWTKALTCRLSLIWGPPGTGKSQTLRALIAGALLDAHQRGIPLRILITANGYTAMDNVLLDLPKLVKQLMPNVPVSYVRLLGRTKEIPADSEDITSIVPETIQASAETQQLWQQLDNPTGLTVVGGIPHQIHNLAIGTHRRTALDQAARILGTQRRWFDLIIVDEASQMDVASATLVVSKAADEGSYVLAGDDLQLPPIHSAEAPKSLERHVGSVFEYVRHVAQVRPLPLNENYRSNATLVEFTRTAGYDPELKAYNPNLCLDLTELPTTQPIDWPSQLLWSTEWAKLLDPNFPATAYTHTDDTSGQANDFEADAVAALVCLLRGRLKRQLLHELRPDGSETPPGTELFDPATDFWEKAVGIVTPHRAQMSRIVTRLQEIFPADEPDKIRSAVDTVERFQGQERAVIIASFGIGDPDLISNEDEFLYSLRRINVLASRARAKLIILSSESLINHLPNDAQVLEESRLLKRFVESYCQPVGVLVLPYYRTPTEPDVQEGFLYRK
ncbi:AAA family ATPase [Hymenobacter setariae]|uniref:AAA family ATPase n=1 Tax=Hymenobacter setariae TaxID=2594794 RepID=A0A558BST7_9BACT|nr:DEAD/DEAH box helicase [Hymenobacter setariae]TVT39608.1 AAA family ATPase [Hymenobacter setariae]